MGLHGLLLELLDEVGALVFDVGHFSFRAGYAGEDTPKTEVPSMVGYSEDATPMEIDANGNGDSSNGGKSSVKKYTIDTTNIHVAKSGKFLCVVHRA